MFGVKKMKNKILALIMLLGLLSPTTFALADNNQYSGDGFGKGDSGYEDGMYLPEMSIIGKYYYKDGEVVNPYGTSKVGKISKEEKEKLLNDKAMKNLIAAYNKFYRTTVNFYKYGEKHMDRWKEVKNMTDPVFKHVNKEKWVEIYNISTETLADVKYYFYSRGLDDGDFTDEETIKTIGEDTKYVLSLDRYKK